MQALCGALRPSCSISAWWSCETRANQSATLLDRTRLRARRRTWPRNRQTAGTPRTLGATFIAWGAVGFFLLTGHPRFVLNGVLQRLAAHRVEPDATNKSVRLVIRISNDLSLHQLEERLLPDIWAEPLDQIGERRLTLRSPNIDPAIDRAPETPPLYTKRPVFVVQKRESHDLRVASINRW